jgi:hypothetical protein
VRVPEELAQICLIGRECRDKQRTRKYAVLVEGVDKVEWVVKLGHGG